MGREDPQLRVRIPEEVKVELEQKAKNNRRTVTAEIVARLEETLLQDSELGGGDGFARLLDDYVDICANFEDLRERYEREYAIDYVDSHKDELRAAVDSLRNILDPAAKHPYK